MRYFLDCEFNGFGGELLSLCLVSEKDDVLYLIHPTNQMDEDPDPWVLKNVIPIIGKVPDTVHPIQCHREFFPHRIGEFLKGDPIPHIIADWPDDIAYFCKALMTGPGEMIALPRCRFDIVRVISYPSMVEEAIQHNAYWDAVSLREMVLP